MTTMKTLVVCPQYPLPETSGNNIRTMHFVRYLQGFGPVDIAYGSRAVPAGDAGDTGSPFRLSLALERESSGSFRKDLVRGFLTQTPLPAFAHSADTRRDFVARVEREDYDLIVLRYAYQAGLIFALPAKYQQRTIIDLDDDVTGSLYESEVVGGATNPVVRFVLERNRSQLRAFERRCLSLGAALVCSGLDRDRLGTPAETAPSVVPNVYASEQFDLVEVGSGLSKKDNLLFVGTLNYTPNSHGLIWFINEFFPVFRSKFPNGTLSVVGRNPTREVREICESTEGVTLHGDVESVLEFYGDCRAVIVPIRTGGGTRIKILEAALAKRPILSTPQGAEGLTLENGQEILLFSDPDEFVRQYSLLSDELTYKRVVNRGFEVGLTRDTPAGPLMTAWPK